MIAPLHPPAAGQPRVLYIHMCALGDAIMASPALRLLKAGLPHARLTVLARSHARKYFEKLPYVDEVISFVEEKHVERARPWRLLRRADELARLLRQLRAGRFDAVVQWRGQLPDTLMSVWTGAPVRVAGVQRIHRPALWPVERVPFAATQLVRITRPGAHLVEAMAAPAKVLVKQLGGVVPADDGLLLDYPLQAADHAEAEKFQREHGLAKGEFAVICISARSLLSVWPMERFSAVADHLREQHGLPVVLTGLPDHLDREERVVAAMATVPVRAVGRLSFGGECALLARSRLLVCLNTGISHVAAALGVPIVLLNGRDGASITPWGVPLQVVTRNTYYPARHPDQALWPHLVPLISAADAVTGIDELLADTHAKIS